ncbi:MAG: M15 family metallopeptidase [Clostridia bacterium]|nr:M15 family metallopeptidase [Clostridia bacterium]
MKFSDSAKGFADLAQVIPDILLDIRYYSAYNFIGTRIDGYERPAALMTVEAAEALRRVNEKIRVEGYGFRVFDAYRPQMAVDHFVRWAKDLADTRMKAIFYPDVEKSSLFEVGFIAEHSGHTRGSTVDLTLYDRRTGENVDMGGSFDYFGQISHFDAPGLTGEQRKNRNSLREWMMEGGFNPYEEEWWHFTLANEPYPDTYFTFPVTDRAR